MKPKIPSFGTDEEAEHFVETADLSHYDLSGLRPVQFEFQPKSAQLNMRLPQPLLEAVKERAKLRGIPYTRLVREALEHVIAGASESSAQRRIKTAEAPARTFGEGKA